MPMLNWSKNKSNLLFIVLAGIFITNALIAEFIGVKIFSLERTLGFDPLNFNIFGSEGLSFNLTAGVLLWPVVFVMTDIINEYFGTIHLVPADFWPSSHLKPGGEVLNPDVLNLNTAFRLIFGQGLWIVIGSLTAFLLGQVIDVYIFHRIKEQTGEHNIWLRSTGSTLISQFIDSYVVLFIAFYIGAGWSLAQVLAIGTVNYIYKFCVAIGMTPIIYLIHGWIDRFLGHELAAELKQKAMRIK